MYTLDSQINFWNSMIEWIWCWSNNTKLPHHQSWSTRFMNETLLLILKTFEEKSVLLPQIYILLFIYVVAKQILMDEFDYYISSEHNRLSHACGHFLFNAICMSMGHVTYCVACWIGAKWIKMTSKDVAKSNPTWGSLTYVLHINWYVLWILHRIPVFRIEVINNLILSLQVVENVY